MKPIEIFEYKLSWKSKGHKETFHSDYTLRLNNWLKENIKHQNYIKDYYTNPYEHTVLFNDSNDAFKFKTHIKTLIKE